MHSQTCFPLTHPFFFYIENSTGTDNICKYCKNLLSSFTSTTPLWSQANSKEPYIEEISMAWGKHFITPRLEVFEQTVGILLDRAGRLCGCLAVKPWHFKSFGVCLLRFLFTADYCWLQRLRQLLYTTQYIKGLLEPFLTLNDLVHTQGQHSLLCHCFLLKQQQQQTIAHLSLNTLINPFMGMMELNVFVKHLSTLY